MKDATEIISFQSSAEWRRWLAKNHERPGGVWIRFFRKSSDTTSINHDQTLDEALCYGWIDGHARPYDDKSWLQKFTPRRPKSIWSKRNIKNVQRLTRLGKMKPSGLAQVTAAKADGRWKRAYDSPANMKVPKDFLQRLSRYPKAEAFFRTLNKTNLYAISWRLHSAKKPETREKRMNAIIALMNKGKKIHD